MVGDQECSVHPAQQIANPLKPPFVHWLKSPMTFKGSEEKKSIAQRHWQWWRLSYAVFTLYFRE